METIDRNKLTKKLIFFAENILRLLDQSGYWASRYAELRFEGKHVEAVRVEDMYLQPLDRKINALVERWFLEL